MKGARQSGFQTLMLASNENKCGRESEPKKPILLDQPEGKFCSLSPKRFAKRRGRLCWCSGVSHDKRGRWHRESREKKNPGTCNLGSCAVQNSQVCPGSRSRIKDVFGKNVGRKQDLVAGGGALLKKHRKRELESLPYKGLERHRRTCGQKKETMQSEQLSDRAGGVNEGSSGPQIVG